MIQAIANSVFRYIFWYIIYNYIKYIYNHIIFIIQAMANSALRYICATTIITRTRHDHQEEKGIHKGRLDKEILSFWSLTLVAVMIGDKSWERERAKEFIWESSSPLNHCPEKWHIILELNCAKSWCETFHIFGQKKAKSLKRKAKPSKYKHIVSVFVVTATTMPANQSILITFTLTCAHHNAVPLHYIGIMYR